MKSHEFTRVVSDMLSLHEPNKAPEENVVTVSKIEEPKNAPVVLTVEPDNTDHTEHNTMIAPLQQQLELQKKDQGRPSWFDDHTGETTELGQEKTLSAGAEEMDPVAMLKHVASILIKGTK